MPTLIHPDDYCQDCGAAHDNPYRWNHAADPRGERYLCLDCYEAAEVFVGHVEDDVLEGLMESDPWPLEGRRS